MWGWIVAQIVIAVISYVLRPKPPTPLQAVAATSLDHPEPLEGESIYVVFGTRDIAATNVVWYGNFRAVPIKRSSGGGKK